MSSSQLNVTYKITVASQAYLTTSKNGTLSACQPNKQTPTKNAQYRFMFQIVPNQRS